jgi:hypothetical protein
LKQTNVKLSQTTEYWLSNISLSSKNNTRTRESRAERETHLPRPSLRPIRNEVNLQSREWADNFAELKDEFFDEVRFVGGVVGVWFG